MRSIVVVAMLGMMGCAQSDFDRWKSAACAGEPRDFWPLVDQDAIRDDLVDALEEDGEAKGKLARVAADKAWDGMREAWDADVRKGRDGSICAMVADSDEGARVTVRRQSGAKARLRFSGGKLVSYRAD
jgi:hypothetical protein